MYFFYLPVQALMMRRNKVDLRMVVDRRGKTVMDRRVEKRTNMTDIKMASVMDRVKMVEKVMDRRVEKRTNMTDRRVEKRTNVTDRKMASVMDRVKMVEKVTDQRTNSMDRVKSR